MINRFIQQSKTVFVISMLSFALIGMASNAQAKMISLPDFSELAEKNSPVVVNISTTKKVSSRRSEVFDGIPDEMLRYFFGLPRGSFPRDEHDKPEPKQQEASSLGSGFILSSDGYIVTNNHVIADADEIIVKMRNRQELIAEVIGTDPRSDIALLKVDAKDLPYAKIGKSKSLKVGQWVLAIGEPFGLDYTVTHGIISALGRALPDDTYVPFIQTDVSINPGNSGGPLLNMAGEVVGVNSQIYSKSGGSMGLSFSIPIDLAMHVVEQLKDKGYVDRGFLGVQVQEVSSDLAKSFGMSKPVGALVAETIKDSPAERAGLQPGDIILYFDGQAIEKSADLPPIVGTAPVYKKLKMTVLRNGKKVRLNVKLEPLDKKQKKTARSSAGTIENATLNMEVSEVDQKVLKEKNLPFGLRVIRVHRGPAQNAGIVPGDIVVTVNFQPIRTENDLKKAVKSLPKGRSVPVRIVREDRSIFLPLVLK